MTRWVTIHATQGITLRGTSASSPSDTAFSGGCDRDFNNKLYSNIGIMVVAGVYSERP